MSQISPSSSDASPLTPASTRRAVSWRSVFLGLLGVIFICGLTPYNDYVVNNTYMVGNFLPIGLVLFFGLFILLINAPLSRFAPDFALTGGELAVALGMTLVSCGIPSSGLMRYLPAQLVGVTYLGGINHDYGRLLEQLQLPQWIFPTLKSQTVAARAQDPVIQQYWNRAPVDVDTFMAHFNAVPWKAWLTPALVWGALVAALWTMIFCMVMIVRRQWADNERLPFPLAMLYVSLVEPPARGKWLNALFSARSFWIGFGIVFFIHTINGLHAYDSLHWPDIPIGYKLNDIFSDPPWRYLDWPVKNATLYFSIIGITYFIQTNVAFSLWAFLILLQIPKMVYGVSGVDWTYGGESDQLFGALIAYVLAILWVGRQHWALVIRQMFRGARAQEPQGRYLPYFLCGWGFVTGAVGIIVWLVFAGCTVVGAVVLVVMMLMLMLAVIRIVCETGLIFVQIPLRTSQPWVFLAQGLPGGHSVRTTLKSYFYTNLFHTLFTHDQREAVGVFASQAYRVADIEAYENDRGWRRGIAFTGCLAVALFVGYVTSGASTLYSEYAYGATLDKSQTVPINPYGVDGATQVQTMRPTVEFMPPRNGPAQNYNRYGHFTFGLGLTAALSFLRIRYVSWPLHPIGYLLVYSYTMKAIWFSVFIGWLAKIIVIRFGGGTMFRGARPFFVGLIFGEAGAAAMWLVVSLVRLAMGLNYERINLLPG